MSFAAWRDCWAPLAAFGGAQVPDPRSRTERVLELWAVPVPGDWRRCVDSQLLDRRYRRGDLHCPHPGEHTIEHRILVDSFDLVRCCGVRLVDGINAFPLSRDTEGGARRANVEADMLLLGEEADSVRFFLCEVKVRADDPWFAAVELLRQMKLFLESPSAWEVMTKRGSLRQPSGSVPVTGIVVAPLEYYAARGKKQNALSPAQNLFRRFRAAHGVDLRFTTWHDASFEIRNLI
jgi:hypothetical protein